MDHFNQEAFNTFVLDNNIIGFLSSSIMLNSGRESHWYVNWRTVSEDVFLLDRLTDFTTHFIKDLGFEPDTIYGVPEGATKVGLFTQYKFAIDDPSYGPHSHRLAMGRGKPKAHGALKDRYFVGIPEGKTLILEDVTTTGGSLIRTIDTLLEAHVDVIGAIGLTNRMEVREDGMSVEDAISSRDVPYYSMSRGPELLPEAYLRDSPAEWVAKKVEDEYAKHGLVEMRLR